MTNQSDSGIPLPNQSQKLPQGGKALILQTIKELNKAGLNNNIYLIKVPAHSGIQGNEQADKLAKLATTVTSFLVNS